MAMIPIKLALRNFMCYRDNIPPINFEGIHTACISGNNGNGKSALIDAITWALWGQTRATSDDELVHAGQSEVEVEFEFSIGLQRYRIIRKHAKPRTQKSSGQTILEFQAATPDGYKALTGDTVTQTQQKITQMLHMDYETFINSAFLRQGRADEFTKKRPNERKQVLGNILQLSVYDALEDQAKEAAKQQETAITQLESAIAGIQEELCQKPVYLVEFEQSQNELRQAEKLAQDQESRLSGLRKEKEGLENKKTQLTELAAHIQDTESNYNLWKEQARQCRARIQAFEELIAQRKTIEEQYNRFIGARQQCLDFEQKFKQASALTQSQHRLEMAIVKAGEELNRSHAVAQNKIQELELISQKLPQLEDELKEIVSQLRTLDEADIKLQEKREISKLQRARVHFLQAEIIRLCQEKNQVEDKLKMLSGQSGITCPLCETELGAEGQKRIEAKFLAEKVAKIEACKASEGELEQNEADVRVLENDILQSEAKLKHAREVTQSKYGNLNKAITDTQEAGNKISDERKALDGIEQKLASRDFAAREQDALAQIEKEIESIGYNSEQHETLRSQLAGLEQYESPKRRLEEADKLILQEKEAEAKACRTVAELSAKMESDGQRRQSLLSELGALASVSDNLTLAESEYQRLLAVQKQIREVMGGAKAKLERLAELETKNKEKEDQLSRATKQEKILRELAQAFGKKGIQAMLIEIAIPEIEAEANKLLARMTDNRMHIKLETQRETKKGDVMETLDINISDELGTRNYEMFSGGEAFRIDFAIRVALSKLLARRAGAPLPTLIIDEGFGTQDSSGIEKIKEAITSIQDDFEKILVITHIADFKDSFPMRIEVVKTPEGSTIYLN
jgi:exonuclease SbcC